LLVHLQLVSAAHASAADDVPALASNITQRLIYRASGLRQFWDDQYVRTARLQSEWQGMHEYDEKSSY
jgi:hypothetical protein